MKSTPFAKVLLASSLACVLVAPVSASDETVRVGFIDILSGPFAQSGVSSLQHVREVVIQLNANRKPSEPLLEIVPFDNKGSPQDTASALKAVSDKGIRFITQGGGSGVALALVDAINKMADRDPSKAMVYLNYAAMDPALTNEQCSFWHFRFYPSADMKMDAMARYLAQRKDIRKVHLLNQNYAHGQQVSRLARANLVKVRPDIEVVGDDFVPLAQTRDFAPYVAKIKSSGADTVITSNWGSDSALLFKAAREAGLQVNFVTMNANNPGTPMQLASYGAGKVFVLWPWSENAPSPEMDKIGQAYKAKYGEEFLFATHWHTMSMLRRAITQAKSTEPRLVAYALEGMKYASPIGDVEMRSSDHQLLAPIHLNVWDKQNGTTVRYDLEKTGYGFRSELQWNAASLAPPTTCQMRRPPR